MRIDDFQIEHRFATVNGLRMHYVEKGERGRPLLVLLHGFPELWWSWRRQIDPLVDAGFRVIAPDLRGYGKTERSGPYDLDTLAADVCALLDHVQRDTTSSAGTAHAKAVVVGHDWGGAVAWHIGATRPEHCERLVVMNCPHPALFQRALLSKWSQIKRSWYMFFFLLPRLPERMLTRQHGRMVKRMFLGAAVDRSRFDDEELQPYRDAIVEEGAAKAMVGWYRTALRAGLRDRKAGQRYPSIEAPTMLLWAMDDVALGYDDLVPGTDRFVKSLRIQTIERCGHFVQMEAPEKVTEHLLSFLRATDARAHEEQRA